MKTKIEIIETRESGKVILADGKRIELDQWDRKAMVEAGLSTTEPEHIAKYLEWQKSGERHIN